MFIKPTYTLWQKPKHHPICSVILRHFITQKLIEFSAWNIFFFVLLKPVWGCSMLQLLYSLAHSPLPPCPLFICVSSLCRWLGGICFPNALSGMYVQKQSNCALSWPEKWWHFDVPWFWAWYTGAAPKQNLFWNTKMCSPVNSKL